MIIFFYILICLLAGVAAHEVFRRYKIISVIFFGVAPLLLTPIWMDTNQEFTWLGWAKVYSTSLAASWILVLRFTDLKKKKWAYYIAYFIFMVNIIEAIIRVFLPSSSPINFALYLNGISGLFLLATVPPISSLTTDPKGLHDLLWDVPYVWIFGYSLWIFGYMYENYPSWAGFQLAITLAPLLVSLFNRKFWVQARVSSLSFYFIISFTFPSLLDLGMTPWYNKHAIWLFAILSFVWTSSYLSYTYIRNIATFWSK